MSTRILHAGNPLIVWVIDVKAIIALLFVLLLRGGIPSFIAARKTG